MEEFIKAAAVQLGIGEDKIKSATGGLLGMIKEHAGEGLASDIMNKLPGASALVNESGGASGGGSVGGGMLGGLMSSASKMLGGNAGKALGLAAVLKSAGLSLDQTGSFVNMFADFVKSKLGDDLWNKVAEFIPDLNPAD